MTTYPLDALVGREASRPQSLIEQKCRVQKSKTSRYIATNPEISPRLFDQIRQTRTHTPNKQTNKQSIIRCESVPDIFLVRKRPSVTASLITRISGNRKRRPSLGRQVWSRHRRRRAWTISITTALSVACIDGEVLWIWVSVIKGLVFVECPAGSVRGITTASAIASRVGCGAAAVDGLDGGVVVL